MDNLRYLNFGPQSCEGDLDSDTDSIAAAIDQTPATPTKQRPNPSDDRTPRSSHCTSVLTTPRPRPRSGRGPHPSPLLDRSSHDGEKDAVVGCTLSFLLRVPELASLASPQALFRRQHHPVGWPCLFSPGASYGARLELAISFESAG